MLKWKQLRVIKSSKKSFRFVILLMVRKLKQVHKLRAMPLKCATVLNNDEMVSIELHWFQTYLWRQQREQWTIPCSYFCRILVCIKIEWNVTHSTEQGGGNGGRESRTRKVMQQWKPHAYTSTISAHHFVHRVHWFIYGDTPFLVECIYKRTI